MADLEREKLISAVYSTTLSPDNFDETLDELDQLIFSENGLNLQGTYGCAGKPVRHKIDSEILFHFRQAFDIQSRIGRQRNDKPRELLLLDAAPNPAWIFNRNEAIIATNNHAKNLGRKHYTKLSDCYSDSDTLDSIRNFINTANDQKILVIPGVINKDKNVYTCILIRKIDKDGRGNFTDSTDQSEELFF